VLCGSAFKNKGIQSLLNALVAFLPSPVDIGPVKGIDPRNDNEVVREPDDEAPHSAPGFQDRHDSFRGKTCVLQDIFGRFMNEGIRFFNTRTGKRERINRLFEMHANKQECEDQVSAGDICAGCWLQGSQDRGHPVCHKYKPVVLESMEFPEPVIGVAIETKTQPISTASLHWKTGRGGSTFQVRIDPDTTDNHKRNGKLHLEILIDRLKREFKVECNQGVPQVAYKEAISTPVEFREVFRKQTGGKGKFADISATLMPAENGTRGLEFVNEIKGGNIPKEFIPSVEKGFREAMSNGPLAGFPLENLKVILRDGSYHPVDSDALSFEIAAKQAFRKYAGKCNPVILEPIMSTEVITPEDYLGDVISDFNRRRGKVEGMESKAGARVVKAKVPLAEKFGYVTVLRTLTSGRATSTMEFSHYEEVPAEIAKRIVEITKGKIL
jgi:elongation factor G